MYGNYSKPKFYTIILILLGGGLILVNFFQSFSFSWLGLILILIGLAQFSTITTTAEEIGLLRKELFDVRKMSEDASNGKRTGMHG